MSAAHSFKPVAAANATRLVLGSMPGCASLERQQYYAHPRNAFWPIMARLFNIDERASYPCRVAQLRASGIALWDVLRSCERIGSLDSNIVAGTAIANNFEEFLLEHPGINTIYFNGAKAEALFKQHSLAGSSARLANMQRVRLPSTSPAHAAMNFAEKLAHWAQLAGQ